MPGPGTYEAKSTVIDGRTHMFGHNTKRKFFELNKSPGTGAYNVGKDSESTS